MVRFKSNPAQGVPPAQPLHVPRKCCHGDAGFAMLDVLVGVAILGLMGALVVERRPVAGGTLASKAAKSEVSSALRMARGQAIATHRPMIVAVDPGRRAVRLGDAAPKALPAGIEVKMVSTADRPGIEFFPDGSSSGGEIVLIARTGAVHLRVDWVSGRVTVSHTYQPR